VYLIEGCGLIFRSQVISVSNDDEAKDLAASYGALMLLDKMRLYDELVPAILKIARSPLRFQSDAQPAAPFYSDIDQA
jgi:hypothetical protein